jgi:hypothetical protein
MAAKTKAKAKAKAEASADPDAARTNAAPPRTLSPAEALRESLKYRAASSGGEPPEDMDVFRYALSRRIHTLLGDARRCREPACRRLRRCAGPDMRCVRDFPAPPVTQQQRSKAMADIQRALKRRAAELGL